MNKANCMVEYLGLSESHTEELYLSYLCSEETSKRSLPRICELLAKLADTEGPGA